MKVVQSSDILIGDYFFHEELKSEVLDLLKVAYSISREHSNVKAFHTDWDWEPENLKIRNVKAFILSEIEKFYEPGKVSDGTPYRVRYKSFWANVYHKGDYAQSHCHKPFHYSVAYFLKCKWYDSPLVFTESGKRVRPKEGRFVAFPAHMKHHVPKHRYNDTRITLSANFCIPLL